MSQLAIDDLLAQATCAVLVGDTPIQGSNPRSVEHLPEIFHHSEILDMILADCGI